MPISGYERHFSARIRAHSILTSACLVVTITDSFVTITDKQPSYNLRRCRKAMDLRRVVRGTGLRLWFASFAAHMLRGVAMTTNTPSMVQARG